MFSNGMVTFQNGSMKSHVAWRFSGLCETDKYIPNEHTSNRVLDEKTDKSHHNG